MFHPEHIHTRTRLTGYRIYYASYIAVTRVMLRLSAPRFMCDHTACQVYALCPRGATSSSRPTIPANALPLTICTRPRPSFWVKMWKDAELTLVPASRDHPTVTERLGIIRTVVIISYRYIFQCWHCRQRVCIRAPPPSDRSSVRSCLNRNAYCTSFLPYK